MRDSTQRHFLPCAEREAGVASVSAPVRGPSGRVVAAVSISGPIERLSRQPGRLHAATVVAGANKLTEVLRRHAQAQAQAAQEQRNTVAAEV